MSLRYLIAACLLAGTTVLVQAEEGKASDPKAVEERAQAGDVAAMVRFGGMLRSGKGVPQDFSAARSWYEKAAASGSASAMTNLGFMHEVGSGIPQDFAQARTWYEKGARAGSNQGAVNLALLYQAGKGLPADLTQTYIWLCVATGFGHEKAEARRDAMAMKLSPDELRDAQASLVQLLEAIATAGVPQAMSALFDIYSSGQGVLQDDAKACAWIEKAARTGDKTAMVIISAMYAGGSGVPQSDLKAYAWINTAILLGDPDTIDQRGPIEKRLSAEDQEKGHVLAELWSKEIAQRKPLFLP